MLCEDWGNGYPLCLGYICHGRRTIYSSTIFSTIFFGILGSYKLRRMCFTFLTITYDLCDLHDFQSIDARTMTLRKSQGVGTLTVQLPCK